MRRGCCGAAICGLLWVWARRALVLWGVEGCTPACAVLALARFSKFWVAFAIGLEVCLRQGLSLVCSALLVCALLGFLAFSCFLSGLLAFPLCGGAPTFLCLPQSKVGKRKRLKPPAHKRVPWLGGDSGASGIRALAHSAPVTKRSSAPTPHCVRRGWVCQGNLRLRCARREPSTSSRRGTHSSRRRVPQAVTAAIKNARAKPRRPVDE
jgi:hypothetical protein